MTANRDLDAQIAEALGWKLYHVPADVRGQHECEIWTPDGLAPPGSLPPSGVIHPAYCCPEWSSDLQAAIALAIQLGITGIAIAEPIGQLAKKTALECLDTLKHRRPET